MKITAIRETALPINSTIRNAVFDFSEMTTSIVAVVTDVIRDGKPVAGFAFNSTGRYACGTQMRERFIPRILRADPESLLDETGQNIDPAKILPHVMKGEKPGGHSERSVGIGTIEVAIWDAVAKIAGKPLYQVLAERFNGGKVPTEVPCYVGGGWYFPGQTHKDLQDEMKRHMDAGYTKLKMKVGGAPLAEDCKRIEAVLKVVGEGGNIAVDANGKFEREEALAYAKALAPYRLRWFEEPCDPLDFELLAEIASVYDAPLASGENLYSTMDVQNLVTFGGLRNDRDFVQVDPPQAYGFTMLSRTLDMLSKRGWKGDRFYPHGGNQMTLAAVAGFGLGGCESYPGVFGVFGGFGDDAEVKNGMLKLSRRPGIGFEAQGALYPLMKQLAEG